MEAEQHRCAGEALYHIDKVVRETGENYDDGWRCVILNGAYRPETSGHSAASRELEDLIHDIMCAEPEELRIPSLRERLSFLKTTREGKTKMCELMEKIKNTGLEEGRAEGSAEAKREMALNMFSGGEPFSAIERYTGCGEAELRAIAAQRGVKRPVDQQN
ncbi:MAG: hypothetical protein IJ233_02680 [Pyramidobacter sp.]|nr:hypothetical protein [Pyramidobacter sp.]